MRRDDDPVVAAAMAAAREAGRKLNRPPGEFLGAAWIGAHKAAAAGKPDAFLKRAARWRVLDDARDSRVGGRRHPAGLVGDWQAFGEPPAPAPADDPFDREAARRRLDAALGALPRRERTVVRLYFGLDGPPLTLSEVGRAFGVGESMACNIVRDGLDALRPLVTA